jgi:hypothetical protein
MTANLTFLWPGAALHPAGKVKKLVVDAVWCERVSRPCYMRKKQGKLQKSAVIFPAQLEKVADLARYSLAPAKSEQGT